MYRETKRKFVGHLLLLALVVISAGSSKIHALDASFEAQGIATFSCSPKNAQRKRLEKFEHNAPDGSTVLILPATQGDMSGGVAFGEPITVGHELTGE